MTQDAVAVIRLSSGYHIPWNSAGNSDFGIQLANNSRLASARHFYLTTAGRNL